MASTKSAPRKIYESPRIVWREPLQAVAVTCAKGDDATCGAGPIAS